MNKRLLDRAYAPQRLHSFDADMTSYAIGGLVVLVAEIMIVFGAVLARFVIL